VKSSRQTLERGPVYQKPRRITSAVACRAYQPRPLGQDGLHFSAKTLVLRRNARSSGVLTRQCSGQVRRRAHLTAPPWTQSPKRDAVIRCPASTEADSQAANDALVPSSPMKTSVQIRRACRATARAPPSHEKRRGMD